VLVLSLVAAPLLVSACGSSSSGSNSNGEAKKAGPQVAKDAAAALGATDAVHVAGTMTDSATKKPVKFDLQLQADGTSGTLAMSGQTVSIISVGGATYIKASAAFYEAQQASPTAAAKLADRWVKAPTSQEFDSFTLSGLSKSLGEPDGKIDDAVTTGSLNGQDVVIVSQTDGSKLYVAGTGEPIPLQITNSAKSSDGEGTVSFTDYGKHQTIKAPADAIDASSAGA
jgi:hypothetical protein